MTVADRWQLGAPYERYIGRWSRLVASRFVDGLCAPHGLRWIDVGSGTGVLVAAILDQCAPSSVLGVDPSEGFLEVARVRPRVTGRPAARFEVGDAEHVPVADGSADVVVSGLVLNFVPDPPAALAEFSRIAAPGALVGAYVWDYAEGMELLRLFWDAATSVDPDAAALDEGRRFPLCAPEPLRDLWTSAPGMDADSVVVQSIDVDSVFADFDDLWDPFLGAQGPAPSYLAETTDAARTEIRDRMRAATASRTRSDGAIELHARAWSVSGRLE
ncbi:class I SAM-dependent methyltransferase [Agromyces sp. SYSU T0242]|uniref:class I SAM-dependent methyltransferase n=1 Tax=Agromyces litoreus TaxID=3158561 RepID=UPI003392F321